MSTSGSTGGRRGMTLIALLRRTSRLMVEEITERMEAAGYAWAPAKHYPVFESIDAKGTRLTVLAARAGMTHQAMAKLVTELEERGIVERTPDPSDRRARLVRLTDEGRERVRTALLQIAAIEQQWDRRWQKAGLRGNQRAAFEEALREVGGPQA